MNINKTITQLFAVMSVGILVLMLFVGGCKKGGGDTQSFYIELAEQTLSVSDVNSMEDLEFSLLGDGVGNIILDTIQLKGDNPSSAPLDAVSAERMGNRVLARFPKSGAIQLLSDPTPNTMHTFNILFFVIEKDQQMSTAVSIKISSDSENGVPVSGLSLELDPDLWNLNYSQSAGTVEAFIRGEDIENIDLTSFEIMGDNPAATAVPADSASLSGDHIHARFAKNQLIDLLLTPADNTVHTITVSFTTVGGGERIELTAQITIEEEDPVVTGDPANLTLEIDPSTWNMNYATSSGSIKAFIRGDGLDGIDLDSIEMYGDNSAALPLPADSASLQGEHVKASFPKNQLLDLLLNPASGTTHTVTVKFLGKNGNLYELTDQVSITGK